MSHIPKKNSLYVAKKESRKINKNFTFNLENYINKIESNKNKRQFCIKNNKGFTFISESNITFNNLRNMYSIHYNLCYGKYHFEKLYNKLVYSTINKTLIIECYNNIFNNNFINLLDKMDNQVFGFLLNDHVMIYYYSKKKTIGFTKLELKNKNYEDEDIFDMEDKENEFLYNEEKKTFYIDKKYLSIHLLKKKFNICIKYDEYRSLNILYKEIKEKKTLRSIREVFYCEKSEDGSDIKFFNLNDFLINN